MIKSKGEKRRDIFLEFHVAKGNICYGGGIGDVFSGVGDAVSDVVGGVSDALAGVDDVVNDVIPGGWGTVAAGAAAYFGVPIEFGTEALAESGLTASEMMAAQEAGFTAADLAAWEGAGFGDAGTIMSDMMAAQEAGFTPEELAAWKSSPVPGMTITDALKAAKGIVGGTGNISSGLAALASGGASNGLAALASGAASLYGGEQAAKSAENALAETRRQFDIGQTNTAPWLSAGKSALGAQLDLMGLPGGTTGDATNQLSALQSSPGYNFRLDQGRKGFDASAAARGGMGSGKAATGAIDWNQKQASSEYGNRLNQLAGLSGTGQTQANLGVNAGQNYASDIGSGTLAAGAARQSGIIGAGNALSSFLNPTKQITGYNPVTGAPIYA